MKTGVRKYAAEHIANAAIQARLRRLVEKSCYPLPVLCTPDELTGELYE
jgi:hypothetical protein